jgi:hypothetical protein
MTAKELHNAFPAVPESFHARIVGTLEQLPHYADMTNHKEDLNMQRTKSIRGWKTLRTAAVAAAAAIALTVGVGAATGLNGNVFTLLFGGGDNSEVELHKLGHTFAPEVSNMVNHSDNLDIEILGVAGDTQNIHVIAKLVPKNGYEPNVNDYLLTMRGFTPLTGRDNLGVSSGGAGALQILDTDETGITVSVQLNYTRMGLDGTYGGLEAGHIHMYLINFNWDEKGGSNLEDVATFDVLVDYDFSVSRSVDVNENVEIGGMPYMLRTIELTPISLRYTTDYLVESPSMRFTGNFNASITFNCGKVTEIDETAISGGGGFSGLGGDEGDDNGVMVFNMSFDVPFDVNEVYSVTIDGNTFVL